VKFGVWWHHPGRKFKNFYPHVITLENIRVLQRSQYRIDQGDIEPVHFDLTTSLKTGWNPIQEGLENSEIDCAFVLAPIAMDLFAYDSPIRLVLFAHKNGSTFIRSRHYDPRFDSLQSFYRYKVVDIPHKMSVHHMLAHQFLKELGLKPGGPGKKAINVRFEVVPPVKMPGIMKENEDVAGFMVAEPVATKAIVGEIGNLEFYLATRWDNHLCCIVAMQEDFIQKHPEAPRNLSPCSWKPGNILKMIKSGQPGLP